MIDHLSLRVTDLDRTLAAYRKALAPLGIEVLMDLTREQVPHLPVERAAGLGADGKATLWLAPAEDGLVSPTHLAFAAPSREVVDAFHAAALDAGCTDNGAPGVRPHYHEHYYGAFVLDPDGYNLEAVCHAPG